MAELRQLLIDKLNSNIAKIAECETKCETKKATHSDKTAEITKHYDDIKQQLTNQNTNIMEKYKQIKINHRKKIDLIVQARKDSEIPKTIKITADTKIIIDAINDAQDKIKQNIGSTLNIQISQTSTLEQEITPDTYFDITNNRSRDGIEQWINIKINDYNQSKTDQIIVNDSNSKILDLVIKAEDKVDQKTNWTNISQQTYLLRNYELTNGTKPFENYSVYFSVGDGTCLIHSLLNAISETYRNISTDYYKSFIGRYFRQHIFVNFVEYANTKAGVKAKQILQTNIQSDSFMEDTSIGLFARTFKVNIILFAELYYMDNAGNLILPSHYEIFKESDDYPYIFIYNISGIHFNTIRNGEKFIFSQLDVQFFIDNLNFQPKPESKPEPNTEPKSESESESESKQEIKNLTFENIIKLTPSQIQNSNEDYLKNALSIISTTDINTINYNSDELKHKLLNYIKFLTQDDVSPLEIFVTSSRDTPIIYTINDPKPIDYNKIYLIQNKGNEQLINKTLNLHEYYDTQYNESFKKNPVYIHLMNIFNEPEWTILTPKGSGLCLLRAIFSGLNINSQIGFDKPNTDMNMDMIVNILMNGLKYYFENGDNENGKKVWTEDMFDNQTKIFYLINNVSSPKKDKDNPEIIYNIPDNQSYPCQKISFVNSNTYKYGIYEKSPFEDNNQRIIYSDNSVIQDNVNEEIDADTLKAKLKDFLTDKLDIISSLDVKYSQLLAIGLSINILVLSDKDDNASFKYFKTDGTIITNSTQNISGDNTIIVYVYNNHFNYIDCTNRHILKQRITDIISNNIKWTVNRKIQ